MGQQLVEAFEHHGLAASLAQQPQHLGVTVLTVDENLLPFIETSFDAVLQLQYHRAAGVHQSQVVFQGHLVGTGRLTVSPDEHGLVAQHGQLFVANDAQATPLQALYFLVVVHNVTQAIQVALLVEQVLRHLNSVDYPEAKAGVGINTDAERQRQHGDKVNRKASVRL